MGLLAFQQTFWVRRSVHDSQQRVSTLWSGITPSDQDDMEESEVGQRDIAALHNVVPQQSRPQRSLKKHFRYKLIVAGF